MKHMIAFISEQSATYLTNRLNIKSPSIDKHWFYILLVGILVIFTGEIHDLGEKFPRANFTTGCS